MRTQYTLTPQAPSAFWSLPFNPDYVSVSNYTASPLYLRVGTNVVPSSIDYTYVVPAGVSAIYPTANTKDFAAALAAPLSAAAQGVNLTDRVDVVFSRDEQAIMSSQNIIARNTLNSYAYNVPAGQFSTPLVLDTRYARSISLGSGLPTGGGRGSIAIMFGPSAAGPWTVYRYVRLPPYTGLSYSAFPYLQRALPCLGPYTALQVYEFGAVNPISGTLYYALSPDAALDAFQDTFRVMQIFDGSLNSSTTLFSSFYFTGIVDWLEFSIINPAAYDGAYVALTGEAVGMTIMQIELLVRPAPPNSSVWTAALDENYRTVVRDDLAKWHIPLDFKIYSNWTIVVQPLFNPIHVHAEVSYRTEV